MGDQLKKAVGKPSSMATITVTYDNNRDDERLKTAWGFSALIEFGGETVLFDTGGDSKTLLGNMRLLGIQPEEVDSVGIIPYS